MLNCQLSIVNCQLSIVNDDFVRLEAFLIVNVGFMEHGAFYNRREHRGERRERRGAHDCVF